MKRFYHEVDLTSRQAMVDFLANHFRYNTANSWNGSTSYACNLKLWHLGLPADISDKLFEMLYTDDFAIERSELIHQFDEAHNYKWQAARNGGYLVLYQGDLVPTEHKSYCPACGQRNFTTVEETVDTPTSHEVGFLGTGAVRLACNAFLLHRPKAGVCHHPVLRQNI